MHGFISYAHDDYNEFELFRKHLKAVEPVLQIDFWADKRLKAGDYWNQTIIDAIDRASVHIILFSPGGLASDFIIQNELPRIAGHKVKRNDLVLPLVIKDCLWHPYINVLQGFPNDGTGRVKPICDWTKEKGYAAANKQIFEAIKTHFKMAPKNVIDWGTA